MAHLFNLAPTTVNRNYNEAMKYHKLRKLKKSKKKGKNTEEEEEEASATSETSKDLSDDEAAPVPEETVVELVGEMPKLPLVPKQEPVEQASPSVSKQQ